MALTLKCRFSATILDAQNVEADCNSYALVDPTAAFSTVITTFNAWLSALDAVTSGRIIRAQCTFYPGLPALKGVPSSDSRVSETGLLAFTGTLTPRRDSTAIPAIADSLLNPDGSIVTGSGAVATFISLIQSGGSSLEFSTSDFDAPLTFKDSALGFRNYNRQLNPKTVVLAQ